MRVEVQRRRDTRVPQPLLNDLGIHSTADQMRRSPVSEKTPGDVRQPQPVRDRLNVPGEDMLVPDRTGLQLCSALLDAVGKHPIVILRVHLSFEGEQTIDVRVGQANDAVSFLVLRGVELAFVHRALGWGVSGVALMVISGLGRMAEGFITQAQGIN